MKIYDYSDHAERIVEILGDAAQDNVAVAADRFATRVAALACDNYLLTGAAFERALVENHEAELRAAGAWLGVCGQPPDRQAEHAAASAPWPTESYEDHRRAIDFPGLAQPVGLRPGIVQRARQRRGR